MLREFPTGGVWGWACPYMLACLDMLDQEKQGMKVSHKLLG
jgi:hypothetical protein